MLCGKCGTDIAGQESYGHAGLSLCEDCYINIVSAPKTCDPWAVYSATRTVQKGEGLTADQRRILDLLHTRGSLTQEHICGELHLAEEDFRTNFATLRHMELARACKKDNQVYYIPFKKSPQ